MWANRLNKSAMINPLSKDLQPAPWRDGFRTKEFIFKPDAEEFYNNGSNNVRDNISCNVCGDDSPGHHCKPRYHQQNER
ncbi:hypothetical protein BAU67_001940 [Escherichia coli]|nr:hypothetical protein [Escherichia coli]EMB7054181.1 hypothetical protein [Escherichia coli]